MLASRPVIAALPGNEALATSLAERLNGDFISVGVHHFPDGEVTVRLDQSLTARMVLAVCTLDRPNEKFLPLVFTAETARELGALKVGLVAPYLAYMRQDKRFHPGEAVTSRIFARDLSRAFDFLVTVDPHLHRYRALSDIYGIPATALHAAPLISDWIAKHVSSPILIGPDTESAQWVAAVAARADAPFLVLEKTRLGDRDVSVSIGDLARWRGRVPVLVDDIISSGRTMIETVHHLMEAGMQNPVCIGVHGIFANDAYDDLLKAGAARVVSSNTVSHTSNAIDVSPLLADALHTNLHLT